MVGLVMDDCTAVVAISKSVPVIHAISGCDTTSKLYDVGKRAALKKFMDSQTLNELGDVFLKISQMEDILS
jgi:hypothetical protein